MDKRIKYVTYYGDKDMTCLRSNSPAADTKTDYVIDTLNRCGYTVELISHSSISIPGFYYKGKVENRGQNTIRYFGSFGVSKFKILNVLNWMYRDFVFLLWCLFHIKRGEQIIVYHSLGYDSIFIWLNKIKKIKIIGEIEEIYQDVSEQMPSKEKNEYRFVKICNKYIFPNTILNERLNYSSKPHLVVHGIYQVRNFKKVPYNDGRKHILYAGTFDPNKGGALASIRAARYLDDKYHLHITGFGDKKNEDAIKSEIEIVESLSKCQISYHGFLDDELFLELMHRCDVGLCTQDPTSLLNLTSFPSKILNYMANGLVVLTGRNKAIEESAVGGIVRYYDKQEPEEIARAIIQCSEARDSIDSISLLNELDKRFVSDLAALLE